MKILYMRESKSITEHPLFPGDRKGWEGRITKGPQKTFGVKDKFIIFITALMSQVYT